MFLKKMNLNANECIAIEDSEIGFNSSSASRTKNSNNCERVYYDKKL